MIMVARYVLVAVVLIGLLGPSVLGAGKFTLSEVAFVSEAVVVTYNARDGNLSVDGNGVLITTLEINLASLELDIRRFDPNWCTALMCGDDVISTKKIFRLDTMGFAGANIGSVLPPDLSAQFLLDDLQIAGSIKPVGPLTAAPGGGPYLYVVPEPTSSFVFILGAIGIAVRPYRCRLWSIA